MLKSNTSGTALKTYWMGNANVLAEADGSGNLTAEYIYFNSKRIARIDLPANTVHYYLSDHLGSSTKIINAAGVVEEESDFTAFGSELSAAQGANHYKFTSKERDTETQLDYFGARYYGNALGRFITSDPPPWLQWQHGGEANKKLFRDFVADPQNLNMNAYVRNNPLNHTDPTGMSDLIFDGQAHTITLVSKDGQVVGTWHAGNNVAIHAPPGEGGGSYTHGPIQDGKYDVAKSDQHGATTHLNGSPDSAYGANGIIHIPNAKGATGDTVQGDGVHSGREDKGGPEAKTAGCIRTTDEATSTINNTAKTDPLQTVTVQNNSQNVQQWKATADAVKKKEGQQ